MHPRPSSSFLMSNFKQLQPLALNSKKYGASAVTDRVKFICRHIQRVAKSFHSLSERTRALLSLERRSHLARALALPWRA
jgi:hypothetical protein